MDDYPRTLMEFERRFASEAACRAYLVQLRWPEGVRCFRCHSPSVWATARDLYHCPFCGFQTSVLAGTIFQDTKADLRLWFRAMWYVTNQQSGVSALGLQRIPDASAASLIGFVREAVEPDAIVRTDGWTAYPGLARAGYPHKPRVVSGSGHTASTLLPRVHRVAALLKRWLLGIHQGAVSPGHLDGYLDEFTFRFNQRTSRWRGKLFYRLVQQAVQVPPAKQRRTRKAAAPA